MTCLHTSEATAKRDAGSRATSMFTGVCLEGGTSRARLVSAALNAVSLLSHFQVIK